MLNLQNVWLVLIVCLIVAYCIVSETKDRNFPVDKLDIEWDDLNETCIDYLNGISQYPHWRQCIVCALISTIIFFSAFTCMNKNFKWHRLSQNVIVYFLINFMCAVKLIDYFRWHIMCRGWGCMRKKKKNAHKGEKGT